MIATKALPNVLWSGGISVVFEAGTRGVDGINVIISQDALKQLLVCVEVLVAHLLVKHKRNCLEAAGTARRGALP